MERYRPKHNNKYYLFEGGKHHAEKYNSNPIKVWLVNGFMDSLLYFCKKTNNRKVFEIGCGEGQLIGMLSSKGYDAMGMDFDYEAVQISKENFSKAGWEENRISIGDLFSLENGDRRIEGRILICCEVLEHVTNPERGLKIIAECTKDFFIVSVPREPIWRVLNFFRGKYIKELGNTPGHINHWTTRNFIEMVSKYADIVAFATPCPWTMVLARKKKDIEELK